MKRYKEWLSLAEQYLRTSKLILEQIVGSENKWIIISDISFDIEDQHFSFCLLKSL